MLAAAQVPFVGGRLIATPAPMAFVAVRTEYLAITNGDECAAAILNQFELWTVGKLEKAESDDDLWVWKSQPELVEDLLHLFSLNQVKRGLKALADLGYLEKRSNPRFRRDRTLQYRFDADAVQTTVYYWLQYIKACTDRCIGPHRPMQKPVQTDASAHTDLSIGPHRPMDSEITYSKNTTQNTTETSSSSSRARARTHANGNGPKTDDDDDFPEKGKEGEKEIFQLYREHFGDAPPFLHDDLRETAKAYPPPWITEAFRRGKLYKPNDLHWPYVKAVLIGMQVTGGPDGVKESPLSEGDQWLVQAIRFNYADEELPAYWKSLVENHGEKRARQLFAAAGRAVPNETEGSET